MKYPVISTVPRTAETGTFQACQQVRQFVAMDLHPTTTVQKSEQTILGHTACTECKDVAYCYRCSVVCVCVCLLDTTMSCTKAAKPFVGMCSAGP